MSMCGPLDRAQNKQAKIKPQKDGQSPCLKFLQTEDQHGQYLKGLRNCPFCGYFTKNVANHEQTASLLNEAQLFTPQ